MWQYWSLMIVYICHVLSRLLLLQVLSTIWWEESYYRRNHRWSMKLEWNGFVNCKRNVNHSLSLYRIVLLLNIYDRGKIVQKYCPKTKLLSTVNIFNSNLWDVPFAVAKQTSPSSDIKIEVVFAFDHPKTNWNILEIIKVFSQK